MADRYFSDPNAPTGLWRAGRHRGAALHIADGARAWLVRFRNLGRQERTSVGHTDRRRAAILHSDRSRQDEPLELANCLTTRQAPLAGLAVSVTVRLRYRRSDGSGWDLPAIHRRYHTDIQIVSYCDRRQ
jgi:hypothetical protein